MTASRPPGEPRHVAYLYLLPAFAVYAAFLLYPIGRAVQLSLYDWDGLSLGRWVGLDNYLAILSDEGLRAAFGHALVLIVFYAAGPLVIGLALAAILNHAKVRGLGFRWMRDRYPPDSKKAGSVPLTAIMPPSCWLGAKMWRRSMRCATPMPPIKRWAARSPEGL